MDFREEDCEVTGERHDRGGQHTGVVPSGVVVRHRPTGLQASSRAHRSQYRNKLAAVAELRLLVECTPSR